MIPALPAARRSFDAIVVGGGIAGSSLATVLARAGLDVALVERAQDFGDRVRGEALAPWGVVEARRLGLLDALLDRAEAHPLPLWSSYADNALRWISLPDQDPHGEAILSFRHQRAQNALWDLAQCSGVAAYRPAHLDSIGRRNGDTTVRIDGTLLHARLVIGADGRSSRTRRALGRRCVADEPTHTVSGLLASNTCLPPDSVLTKRVRHGRLLLFPIGASHTRIYYMADLSQTPRLRGPRASAEILALCQSELDPRWFADAAPAGPSATFPNANRWVPHPWVAGLVLVGDAAGTGDPSIGQGLSVTLRDVRELSNRLLDFSAWDEACAQYARERLRYFQTQRMIARWTWEMDEPGPKGARVRRGAAPGHTGEARAELMRRIRLDPARVALGRRSRRLVLFGEEQGPMQSKNPKVRSRRASP